MAENSAIAWTDHTFNPWMGCTHVSEGCRNCYAEILMDHRYGKVEWGAGKPRVRTSKSNWNKPLKWNRDAAKTGTRPKVFCASLADVFDQDVPEVWRRDLFDLIEKTPNLDWLILTKRPEHIYIHTEFPDNVWLGTTVEDARVMHRVEMLDPHDVSIRWLSVEPMIGPLCLTEEDLHDIDWIIVGGESGPECREFDPDWARQLLDQCRSHGVAFFMKQMGGHPDKRDNLSDFPEDLRIREFPR